MRQHPPIVDKVHNKKEHQRERGDRGERGGRGERERGGGNEGWVQNERRSNRSEPLLREF